ncbi:MAG: glucose-1-phosphate adenylyltransferase subunit GlgD [Clostridia bacterium]|nr:glucose-1-phosphate adenylyltransferase subunit GlgD [Clostridia bacterium]
MRRNNVAGLIFSNMHDEQMRELTAVRTMASVPFGSRYRLIDFMLSGMVNSGITKVGVITKSNYRSLMDHLGSGKAWDLSRKRDGLVILPPYGEGNALYMSRIEALKSVFNFLKHSPEDYILMTDSDCVANFDFTKLISHHFETDSDVTIVYKYGRIPDNTPDNIVLGINLDHTINNIEVSPNVEGECNFGLNIYMFKKDYLIRIVEDAVARGATHFGRDVLQTNIKNGKYTAFSFDTYIGVIHSLESYYEVSMDLLKDDVRSQVFPNGRPIYTKDKDDMPTKYGLSSNVRNSVLADGCIIEGEVENSVIFRGVKIGKGTKVKNSIIIQGTYIGENCTLDSVITDKDVIIKDGRTFMGHKTYPVFINKNRVV